MACLNYCLILAQVPWEKEEEIQERLVDVLRGNLMGRKRRDECIIVTWNVRRLSPREENMRRSRTNCYMVIRERWELVLLSGLLAVDSVVVWLEEEESECSVVY